MVIDKEGWRTQLADFAGGVGGGSGTCDNGGGPGRRHQEDAQHGHGEEQRRKDGHVHGGVE